MADPKMGKKLRGSREGLSRREFLAGAVIGAGAMGLFSCAQGQLMVPASGPAATEGTPCPEAKTEVKEVEVVKEVVKEVPKEVPEWPWPYVKLDPEMIRKKGHLGYYKAHCCYGAFWAIVDSLREEIGFPFDQIPAEMMIYGAGGAAGWGTLCGALNGAFAAINLVTDEGTCKKIVHELMGWYTETPLPTEISNQYASEHAFLVDKYKSDEVLAQSVAGSPLCHVSVTKWCQASGYPSGSPERSERCGRLTGDVAARAVELLNQYADNAFEPAYEMPVGATVCRSCHFKGKEFEKGQFTRGKMDCLQCHEPHGKPGE